MLDPDDPGTVPMFEEMRKVRREEAKNLAKREKAAKREGVKYQDVLQLLRSSEDESLAIVLAFDPLAMSIVAMWPMLPLQWTPPTDNPPEDLREAWHWLWSGGCADPIEIAEAIGNDDPHTVKLAISKLINARHLYPDGTVSVAAGEMVRLAAKSVIQNPMGIPEGRESGS